MDLFERVYDFTLDKDVEILTMRTSTLGYQPKAFYNKLDRFVKAQYFYRDTYWDDWKVEILASKISEQLLLGVIKQNPCKVKTSAKSSIVNGVWSDYFLKGNEQFISFSRLLNHNGRGELLRSDYPKLNNVNKVSWIARQYNELCGIPEAECIDYVIRLAIIDLLVANSDRHSHNHGVILSGTTYRFAPIFDCGLGMFACSPDFVESSFDECMRYSYVEPYSEDPFILAQDLKSSFYRVMGLEGKVIDTKNFDFVTKVGEEYFYKMCKLLGIILKG